MISSPSSIKPCANNPPKKSNRLNHSHFSGGILSHPPYSLDLAPSDYHLFRSLRNHLVKKQFDDQAQLKSDLENFFSSLSRKFFEDGILDLPNRWEYVIDNNGIYVVD